MYKLQTKHVFLLCNISHDLYKFVSSEAFPIISLLTFTKCEPVTLFVCWFPLDTQKKKYILDFKFFPQKVNAQYWLLNVHKTKAIPIIRTKAVPVWGSRREGCLQTVN